MDPLGVSFKGTEGSGEAQILGKPSSFDPVEFIRQDQNRMDLYRRRRAAQFEKDYERGLKDYDLGNLKAWEDSQTYKELAGDVRDVESAYSYLASNGFNLSRPRSDEEITYKKAIDKRMDEIRERADIYKLTGDEFHKLQGEIATQSTVDESKRTMNVDQTRQKAMQALSIGDPIERLKAIRESRTFKPLPVDLTGYVSKAFKGMPGLREKEKTVDIKEDPATGKIIQTTWKGWNPDEVRDTFDTIYEQAPDNVRTHIAEQTQKDNTLYHTNKSPQQWLYDTYGPSEKGETKKSIHGKGGDFIMDFGSGIPEKDDNGKFLVSNNKSWLWSNKQGASSEFISPVTFYLSDIFRTGSDKINLMVSPNTKNVSTGKPTDAGQVYESMPTMIAFYPIADQEIEVPGQGFIDRGERIDAAAQKMIDDMNSGMRSGETLKYHYEPFMVDKVDFSQRWTPDETVKSWDDTYIRPYDEVKDALRKIKKKDKFAFEKYYQAIEEARQQLNRDRYEGILGPKEDKPEPKF